MKTDTARAWPVHALYRRLVPCEPYVTLLDKIQQHLLPRTYLEIGVANGKALNLALPGTRAVGVDPAPRLNFPLVPGARVLEMTSDDFFARPQLDELLAGLPLDLAFIDGMHRFEFALRDFDNIEKAAVPGTTVLIHDCYPHDAETSTRDRKTRFWSGDIWKLIVCLTEYRPDLEVVVADVAPTGLGIVRGLDPASTILADRYDEICARFIPLPFDWLARHDVESVLHRIDGDWATVRAHLPTAPFRSDDVRLLSTRWAAHTLAAVATRWARRRLRRIALAKPECPDSPQPAPTDRGHRPVG